MSELNAAVAAAALGSEDRFRELLRSVVEVARSIFAAKASSILLLDEEANELVFEAVAGEGEEGLLGQRFPAGTGVAGWVLATRTPLVIEDVAARPAFREGRRRGNGLRAAGADGGAAAARRAGARRARGARPAVARFTLQEMELLGLFASQAAIALDLLQRARDAEGRPGRRRKTWRSSPGSLVPSRDLDEDARPGAQALLEVTARRSSRRK